LGGGVCGFWLKDTTQFFLVGLMLFFGGVSGGLVSMLVEGKTMDKSKKNQPLLLKKKTR